MSKQWGTIMTVVFLYTLTGVFVFGSLPSTFFQQDEWAIFGNYLYWDKASLSWFERLFTYEQSTHLIPFSNLLYYLQFRLFGLHFAPYAVASIMVHLANAGMVYMIAYELTSRKNISFLAGLLFIIHFPSQQAVTWIATSTGTAGAAFFFLVCVLYYLKFLKSGKKIYLLYSLILTFISLGFKESSVFAFLVFSLLWYLKGDKKNISFRNGLFVPLLCAFVYGGVRAYFLSIARSSEIQDTLYQPSLYGYGYRMVATPVKFLVQSIVPQEWIILVARTFVRLVYPQFVVAGDPNPFIVESIVTDMVMAGIGIAVILLVVGLFYLLRNQQNSTARNTLLIALFTVCLGSLPLVFLPGRAGYFSLIDGRHLYITAGFVQIGIATLFFGLPHFRHKKIAMAIFCVILIIMSGYNVVKIRSHIRNQVVIGETRKKILTAFTNEYPTLPQKTVVYVTSDKAYYGLPLSITTPPFQSGFGQVVLIWYEYHGDNFPSCFFKEKFLNPLPSHGYQECAGRGFGYYETFNNLIAGISDNAIDPTDIRAFSWKGREETFVPSTQDVQTAVTRAL